MGTEAAKDFVFFVPYDGSVPQLVLVDGTAADVAIEELTVSFENAGVSARSKLGDVAYVRVSASTAYDKAAADIAREQNIPIIVRPPPIMAAIRAAANIAREQNLRFIPPHIIAGIRGRNEGGIAMSSIRREFAARADADQVSKTTPTPTPTRSLSLDFLRHRSDERPRLTTSDSAFERIFGRDGPL